MNLRFVFRQLGSLLLVLSALLALIALWSALMLALGEKREMYAAEALCIAAVVGAAIGFVMVRVAGTAGQVGRREALLLVALSWLVGAALSALPFYAWAHLAVPDGGAHPFLSPVDAYFEAMSGLTTTGATILPNIADEGHAHLALPRSVLLWRSMTHWLGGLGIVVLFVAVLPSLGAGGKRLYKVEAPGPRAEGVTPNIRETARALWMIYLGLTLAEVVALRAAGLNWFDSVCHTFATLATGGFSNFNSSLAGANSAAVEWIVVVFMLLAGINFGLYFMILRGRWRKVLKDTELRVYLGIMAVAALVVFVSLLNWPIETTAGQTLEGTAGEAARYGVFQVVSIQTTTGFGTADFDRWPFHRAGGVDLPDVCGRVGGVDGWRAEGDAHLDHVQGARRGGGEGVSAERGALDEGGHGSGRRGPAAGHDRIHPLDDPDHGRGGCGVAGL